MIFLTMRAKPETTMFDWLRMVAELEHAVTEAVDADDWESVHIYGPNSNGFEHIPEICIQAIMTEELFDGMCEYIEKQGDWILPTTSYLIDLGASS